MTINNMIKGNGLEGAVQNTPVTTRQLLNKINGAAYTVGKLARNEPGTYASHSGPMEMYEATRQTPDYMG